MEQTETLTGKTKNFNLRFSEEQYNLFSQFAQGMGLDLSSFIRFSCSYTYNKLVSDMTSQPVEELQQEECANHADQKQI